jgi:phospholipase/carboxylesterase
MPMIGRVDPQREAHFRGRLTARPRAPRFGHLSPGVHRLHLGRLRDGLISVPRAIGPRPLLVMLHGARGDGAQALHLVARAAEAHGVLVLAPESRGASWDFFRAATGSDVRFLDAALARTFAVRTVDPERVAIGGFSDGASYALSLGLANGDLFRCVLAFSPGFSSPPAEIGDPTIFVAHGTEDKVLPIDVCSRRIAPALAQRGYAVEYDEFVGGHTVPDDVVERAIALLVR